MGQRKKHETTTPAADDDRRDGSRRDASALGPVVARLIGGGEVRLLDFSRRGVLVESETRMLIGARASVKITTTDAVITVAGHVVRSRVAGMRDGGLLYHTALALHDDLSLLEQVAQQRERVCMPADAIDAELDEAALDSSAPAPDGAYAEPAGSERAMLAGTVASDAPVDSVLEFLATVPHDLAELRRRAAVNNW